MKNKIGIVLMLLLFANSCIETEDIIPTRRFSAYIYGIDTDPKYMQENPFIVTIDSYGNTIGNAGVIIYRQGINEYYVFDRMCPYEKQITSLVELEKNEIHCICPTCKSRFAVASEYGGILAGSLKWPLYKYKAEFRDGTLKIWN